MRAALPAALALAALLPGGAAADELRARCLLTPSPKAVGPCEAAAKAAPEDLEIARALAWAYLASYRETDAILLFEELVRRAPHDPEPLGELAGVLAGLRDYGRALAAVEEAIRLEPEKLEHQRLAAILYELSGRNEAAFDMHLRLADAGLSVAMFDLAEDFAQGRGTPVDQRRARHWYERAAGAGHVFAMEVLAAKLERGAFGTPAEPGAAAFWHRQAAEARRGLPERQ